MRNKTFIIAGILFLLFIVSFISCQKFEAAESISNDQKMTLNDANFSPEFKWETTRNITLSITSSDSKVLNITSSDKLTRYHRGMLWGDSKTYTVKISVPTYVKKLSVNNQEITVSSNNVSVNL